MATSGRREAVRLYRDIIRTIRYFNHRNDQGRQWKDVLRESARQEFEMNRFETDPTKVVQLVMVGRDCLMKIQEGMLTGKVNKEPDNPTDSSPFTKVL
ncbi:hypothetical protein DICPUDRAFT_86994 [Dictyostelium purpureum]|uniref:Complex 1 LYR protein domain-containing protein n=1 Tax=Dictyostelium purpureum TaxID=5786 RepID=F0ZF83_DICPU|nr:uncharacterized protein DICPUDRAFT_86994 [Dictyostelium purpureum]EGC37407.1 hypothetical protein DICPUDRAFT_86994 [Dictyostelium purpureum]|eukprot:XP_003286060.1 hypothetical protein DICPUDRAFT_86994 [Dictyostelium purpureum]